MKSSIHECFSPRFKFSARPCPPRRSAPRHPTRPYRHLCSPTPNTDLAMGFLTFCFVEQIVPLHVSHRTTLLLRSLMEGVGKPLCMLPFTVERPGDTPICHNVTDDNGDAASNFLKRFCSPKPCIRTSSRGAQQEPGGMINVDLKVFDWITIYVRQWQGVKNKLGELPHRFYNGNRPSNQTAQGSLGKKRQGFSRFPGRRDQSRYAR